MIPPRGISGLAAATGWLTLAIFTICACSSGHPGRSVASLPGHSAGPATTLTQAQQFQRLVQFARCMRSHGIAVADPQPGKPFGFAAGGAEDPAATAAMRACQHLLPPQTGAAAQNPRLAAELPGLIAYARCMRGHDIAMLDPNSSGTLNLGQVPGITNDYGRYGPQFRIADAACRHLLPAGVHDDGTGP